MSDLKTFPQNWSAPPENLRLPLDEVHIWRASLDMHEADLARVQITLSCEERRRCASYHFANHRRRSIASRGILRNILGRYLQENPHELEFSYGVAGKPFLPRKEGSTNLFFNVAHSEELLLIAVTCCGDIGIDVEQLRPERADMSVANAFFSTGERAALQALPPDERVDRFFLLWTAKEACLKASGKGLTASLSEADISLTVADDSFRSSTFLFRPDPDYAAALVVRGKTPQIKLWQWDFETAAPVLSARDTIPLALSCRPL
jgi:4'-phosphopantetheinyl transferase